MKTPKPLRSLFKHYEREGFTVKEWEPCKGSHFRVWFDQLQEFVVVSIFDADNPRTLKNSIAMYKRMRKQQEEGG